MRVRYGRPYSVYFSRLNNRCHLVMQLELVSIVLATDNCDSAVCAVQSRLYM